MTDVLLVRVLWWISLALRTIKNFAVPFTTNFASYDEVQRKQICAFTTILSCSKNHKEFCSAFYDKIFGTNNVQRIWPFFSWTTKKWLTSHKESCLLEEPHNKPVSPTYMSRRYPKSRTKKVFLGKKDCSARRPESHVIILYIEDVTRKVLQWRSFLGDLANAN